MRDNKHDREEWRRQRREMRDFWRDWRDEQKRLWREQYKSAKEDYAPREEMMGAWREFFRGFMGEWPESHWLFGGRRFSPWHQGQVSFNPFVANILSKGGGLLPLYVLNLVAQKPRYGNEIMEIIAERTGGQWLSNPGAIYPLLTELEQQHLIVGEWDDPQKRTVRIYRVTESGQEELARLKAFVDPKLNEAIEVLTRLAKDLAYADASVGDESGSDQPAHDESRGDSDNNLV